MLEMALRKALENNEMHLHYQPVVDAATGNLKGFEALLRWNSPQFGNVSPVKFIPLAEEARLIRPIGEWVLRTACEEAAKWPSNIRVAVNVSADQLTNPGFVNVVTSALASSGLSVDRLELEVTESVFMHEGLGATKTLERILDLGVKLSLDDFGTGYSSLGYLSRTRFSTIKIDRSFVQGASKGVKEAIAIIRAVVALAQSLGMATTAEGVETESEHQMVHALGCTKVQGYYFGRPLPRRGSPRARQSPLGRFRRGVIRYGWGPFSPSTDHGPSSSANSASRCAACRRPARPAPDGGARSRPPSSYAHSPHRIDRPFSSA